MRRRIAAALVAAGMVLQPAMALAQREVRGTWITTTGFTNGNIRTPAVTATTFTTLRQTGVNSAYVDVWRNGFTYFPSPTMNRLVGRSIASEAGTRDILSETLIQSHRNGITHVAWFQYGLAARFGNPTTSSTDLGKYMADRGWLLRDSAGNFTNASNGFAWMNPTVPEVRRLLIDLTLEAVDRYDLDGVQMDDRLAWPAQFGYDDVTRNAYRAQTGREVPANFADAQFTRWRADQVTAFAREWHDAVKARRPDLIVSVSPSVWNFSYANYCADWPSWAQEGLFDEFIPQVYRSTLSSFNTTWNQQVTAIGSRRGDLVAGIAMNTTGATVAGVTGSITSQRNTANTAGSSIWFSEGVLSTTNQPQFAGYYNGFVERPDLPVGWRPAPIVMTSVGSGRWQANVGALLRYRVVTRVGDVWSEVLNTVLPAGTSLLTLGSVNGAELLVDRRGFIQGDANFDGRVDLDDFYLLQAGFGQSNRLWINGDFTLDGVVNRADFNVLAQFWGTGVSGPVDALPGLIPEPAGIGLVLVAMTLLRRGAR